MTQLNKNKTLGKQKLSLENIEIKLKIVYKKLRTMTTIEHQQEIDKPIEDLITKFQSRCRSITTNYSYREHPVTRSSSTEWA